MPSGLEGSELNQLEAKDENEDLVALVGTGVKTRRRSSPEGRSNAPPTRDEIRHLPNHPNATIPSKDATKIATPMSGNKSKNKVPAMGPQPGSSLHEVRADRCGGGSKISRKRGLPRPAAGPPNDQSRPKKQQKMISAMEPASLDTDDEFMEVHPNTIVQQSESRKLSQSRNISKYFANSQDLSDAMDIDLKHYESDKRKVTEPGCKSSKSEPIGRGDEDLIKSIYLLDVPTKSTHPPNNPGKWSSSSRLLKSDGDLERIAWTNSSKKKAMPLQRRKVTSSKKIDLVCFQKGIESYPTEGDSHGLFIRMSPDRVLTALYGEKGKEREIWRIDLNDTHSEQRVYVNTPSRKFAIKKKRRLNLEPDRTVMFTLESDEDTETCKSIFLKGEPMNNPIEAEEKKFDSMINELKEWKDRHKVITPKQPPEPVATHQHRTRQSRVRSQEISHIEIPARSERNRVDKAKVPSPKHPRASPADDIEYFPREIRSSKPKLELPKPPWKSPLVYPPTDPRKEVIDYDDLKRLDSNSYLNDNIINFYLKYIEVQLRKKCPEVAKETYFLNTFFYERLTKRDEKKKRDFDSVLKWTSKVDIFKTSYIIIPINEATHWYLAIICNLCNLERKMNNKISNSPERKSIDLEPNGTLFEPKEADQKIPSTNILDSSGPIGSLLSATCDSEEQDVEIVETQDNLEQMAPDEEPPIENENRAMDNDRDIIEVEDSSSQRTKLKGRSKLKAKNKFPLKKNRGAMPPDTPSIIILDSMGFGPTIHNGTIKNLREWLTVEAQKKRNLEISTSDIHAAFGKAPNQNNWYDCGLFLLHYVELFFEQPVEFTSMFLAKGDRVSDQALWRKEKIKDMRERLFHLFIELHDEQEAALTEKTPHRQGSTSLNGNGDTSQKVDEGNRPSQDLTEMSTEELEKDKDLRSATPGLTTTVFEKFTGELGELVTSGRGGEGTPTNLAVQAIDKFTTQPINLEEASNILQPGREITLPFRDSQDDGVIIQ